MEAAKTLIPLLCSANWLYMLTVVVGWRVEVLCDPWVSVKGLGQLCYGSISPKWAKSILKWNTTAGLLLIGLLFNIVLLNTCLHATSCMCTRVVPCTFLCGCERISGDRKTVGWSRGGGRGQREMLWENTHRARAIVSYCATATKAEGWERLAGRAFMINGPTAKNEASGKGDLVKGWRSRAWQGFLQIQF